MRKTRRERRWMRIPVAVAAIVLLAGCQIELGSVGNTFGNDPTASGAQPGLWASISGPYSSFQDGDPYATKCTGNNGGTGTSCATTDAYGTTVTGPNPLYRSNGYVWAVDVPGADVGVAVTVSIYDPSFGPSSVTGESYSGAQVGFSTSYHLFETTGDPSTVSTDPSMGMDALGHCTSGTLGYNVFPPGGSSQNAWYALCTFVPDKAGIYPVQVKTSGIPGVADSGDGYNNFSIRATASSLLPHVYELSSLSLFLPPAPTTQLYLTNVPKSYAGHTMVVDLYDPGDGTATTPITMQFLAPPSGAPRIVPIGGVPVACSYNATPSATLGPPTPDTSPACTITTTVPGPGGGRYNQRWLRVVISIPADYSCTTDCWWSVRYSGINDALADRTVWSVNLST